jgi:hypothetical protein
MRSWGNSGSPNALFRRALATNNVTLANTAALEAGRLNLADALALTFLYRDQHPSLSSEPRSAGIPASVARYAESALRTPS